MKWGWRYVAGYTDMIHECVVVDDFLSELDNAAEKTLYVSLNEGHMQVEHVSAAGDITTWEYVPMEDQ